MVAIPDINVTPLESSVQYGFSTNITKTRNTRGPKYNADYKADKHTSVNPQLFSGH